MLDLKIAAGIVYEKVEDQAIVVDTNSGNYYNLNNMALVIFELVKNGCNKAQIEKALFEKYPENKTQITTDLENTINYLIQNKILEN